MSAHRKKLPRLTMRPRPYQLEALELVKHRLATQPELWHLFASPTGTGKSLMEWMVLQEFPDSVLITPRVEIIAGMLQKVGIHCDTTEDIVRTGSSHGLYTPIRFRNLLASGGLPFQPSLIVLDECFPAGTMIRVTGGTKRIEDVQVGDMVTTYNETTCSLITKPVVRLFKNPRPKQMVHITVGDTMIESTPNHPFYTNNGWKNASEITPGDWVLRCVPSGVRTIPISKGTTEKGTNKLLQSPLYGEWNKATPIRRNGTNESQVCLTTHDKEQSIQTAGSPGDDIQHNADERAQAYSSWGQREGYDRMRTDDSSRNRIGTIHVADRQGIPTHSLQTRLGRFNIETVCGSRRRESQYTGTTGTRQTERLVLDWQRVDSVTVHQYRSKKQLGSSDPNDYVYNFETADTHTYIANGCVVHNCHHSLAESWMDLSMYLNGIPTIGFTATPYRGTPKGTQAFREQWGTINHVLTLHDAISNNYCALPSAEVWPLVDDDVIDIVNGEIKVSAADALIRSRLYAIVTRCKDFYHKRSRVWDRPTMFSVPSTETATALTNALNTAGLPAVAVTQSTTRSDRERAFRSVVDARKALVQIDVVSEGVDLPIRRLIDVKPTMSPVRWLQQIGRIMRPIDALEDAPEYICLCRNLERHCYLMEGAWPAAVVRDAQEAFTDDKGNPLLSKRSGTRAVGLEGLGKFVTTPIHFLNGTTGFAYNLIHTDGFYRIEYFILVNPTHPEPLRAYRQSTKIGEHEDSNTPIYDWGKWSLIESIPDLKGCSSANPRPLTPGQRLWWLGEGKHAGRGAESVGLNPHKEVNNRSFQVLPLLKDLRIRL